MLIGLIDKIKYGIIIKNVKLYYKDILFDVVLKMIKMIKNSIWHRGVCLA